MAKQTFTTGQVLTAAQMTSLQQTAMLGGNASAKVASYVLAAADAGTAITMSNGSATTITVNTGLFAAGDIVTIINLGAGVCTITAGTATVTTSGSLALAQNQGGVLRFTSASAAIFFQFATPASGDIEGVTAGTGISGGGTSGTVTITNSMATAIDAKADLVVGTGADTFSRLAVGTNNQVLTADSAEATGLKYYNGSRATLTTTGDILYASAANTPARLGIGSTNQVLTVSGGIPAWATPAGTLTIAQIATGTLSGSSVTISSLSSYNDIWIRLLNVNPSQASVTFIRPNNNTTAANYVQVGGYAAAGATGVFTTSGFGAIGYNVQTDLHATSINNAGVIHLSNCKNAGFTTFDSTVSYNNSANTIHFEQTQGIYLVSEAVSSIVIAPSGGTYDGGTYTIWGA
jgi:hypothetical protein